MLGFQWKYWENPLELHYLKDWRSTHWLWISFTAPLYHLSSAQLTAHDLQSERHQSYERNRHGGQSVETSPHWGTGNTNQTLWQGLVSRSCILSKPPQGFGTCADLQKGTHSTLQQWAPSFQPGWRRVLHFASMSRCSEWIMLITLSSLRHAALPFWKYVLWNYRQCYPYLCKQITLIVLHLPSKLCCSYISDFAFLRRMHKWLE